MFESEVTHGSQKAARPLGDLLRQLLGREANFRPGQREAVEAVLDDGARVLLVQKTGWGKSIVYWLATRVRRDEGHGPTLIISPLLSLMRDQLRAAGRIGLSAVTVNSANRVAWSGILASLQRDEVDVLLISPERLANSDFMRNFLPAMQGSIGLFVVDEVHCISDWGHDFRPDYRRISRILASLPPSVPVLGTTATANARVRDDIASQLGPAPTRIEGPLARESLRLATLTLTDQAERLAWLARYVPTTPGSGIIYCLTVADSERVASWLRQNGIDARPYNGRMLAPEREELEQALLDNKIKVLVATVALGMGFDKPDLPFVVHFQRPGSVIFYYQQVGRAGRAVQDADGILLSGREDDAIQDYFIRTAFPPTHETRAVLDALEKADSATISQIQAQVNLRRSRIEAILKLLEVDGAIEHKHGHYNRTLSPWHPDEERIQKVTNLRVQEVQQMRDYLAHDGCLMRFLTSALDDPATEPCGRCMNCPGWMPLSTVDPELVREAITFLRRSHRPIPPRLQWAAGAVSDLNGCMQLPNEEGVALAMYGDAGWGAAVAEAKYWRRDFGPELIAAAADAIRARWAPSAADGWWVAAVPSRTRATLVGDAARAIAERLGLPYREDVLAKTMSARPQKEMQNSTMQLKNAWHTIAVQGEVLAGPVLLVDDIVDSRWTLTVAGHLLRTHGSGPVYPFAFAEASGGIDG